MNILLDCFGGDYCPDEAVIGAINAVQRYRNLTVTLCGYTEKIKNIVKKNGYTGDSIKYLESNSIITNDDIPTLAIRRKKDASMVVALKALSESGYDGLVSSGNTGALLVGATLIVKLIDGVSRASLSPVIPTIIEGKHAVVVDGGANVDCKSDMLEEFAVMGDVYMREVEGIENPKVALLSNGTEEEKGNMLTKEVHELLKNSSLNFIGNIEAKQFVDGVADVIVTDGFAGNMCIKSVEGTGKAMFTLIKNGIVKGGLRAKLGYLLLKPVLKEVKNTMSSDEVGGAVFLGVKKPVIKAHGSSKAEAFCNAIGKAIVMIEANVCSKIEQGLKKMRNKEEK